MSRVILVGRVVTRSVQARRTIVAGCGFATTLLKLALVDVVDLTVAQWPSLSYAVVVDDIQLQGVGSSITDVTRQVNGATEMLIGLLISVCGPAFQYVYDRRLSHREIRLCL